MKDQNFQVLTGEFDPGSEQTLAACLTHASRTRNPGQPGEYSGARVSNAWVTYPRIGDNSSKGELIPNNIPVSTEAGIKGGLCMQATVQGWARVPLASW